MSEERQFGPDRSSVLEEAAQICDGKWDENDALCTRVATYCAISIRALKNAAPQVTERAPSRTQVVGVPAELASSEAGKDDVGLLLVEDGMFVETNQPVQAMPGRLALRVKKEDASAVLAAFKDAARYRVLRHWHVTRDCYINGLPQAITEKAVDRILDEELERHAEGSE